MQEALNILLVEDNKAISAAYKEILESEGNHVICAFDFDDAVKILNENLSFVFDLLFTDIDLVGDPQRGADKSGISFACYAHKIVPNVPIVGHSAYFDNDDMTPEERACFDEWFPKGIKTADRETMFDKALSLARQKRKERMAHAAEVSFSAVQELLTPFTVPMTSREFTLLGYQKDVVTANENNGFVKPFTVWRRESEDGCELEVVGYPAILAWGDNKEDAYEHLFAFIHSNKDLVEIPDEQLGGSSLMVARFARDVLPSEGDE